MKLPLLRWRVRIDAPLPAAENMAWDHTLALSCGVGEGVLRFYAWSAPTLSLGRNEAAVGVYLPERLAAEGVSLVRRPTGGRAVLHHRELTYCVCAPIRALGGVRAAYATVNRALAEGLRLLGVPVALAGPGPSAHPDAGPCFQAPAEGEVMADAAGASRGKLVGSAQVRIGEVLLQHGSILVDDDQALIPHLRADGDVGHPPATLRELLGREPHRDDLVRALQEGFARVVPGDWRGPGVDGSFPDHGLPSIPRPDLLELYRSPEWTWRR